MRSQIRSSLRPERIAFLVNISDPSWLGPCARIMEYCSLVWGGAGNVIVPTDGQKITPIFWHLLERFEPDYITYYKRSGGDVKLDEPAKFQVCLDAQIEKWETDIGEKSTTYQRQHIEQDLLRTFADDFSISQALHDELRDRLAPFYFGEQVAHQISANSEPSYPHTQINHVLKAASDKFGPVHVYEPANADLKLWVYSSLGHVNEENYARYTDNGLSVHRETVTDLSTIASEVVAHAIGMSSQRPAGGSTPLDITRVVLGQYQALRNHDYSLSTQIVVDESLIDFCYYMCLSRMRVRVLWLPRWLLQPKDGELSGDVLPDAFYFSSAVKSAAGYSSQHNNTIDAISLTMNAEQIKQVLSTLEISSLSPLNWQVPESYNFDLEPARLYERNNAGMPELHDTNSGGVIELYKGRTPKHLRDFSPQDVRWIVELSFADVQIPRHSALGTWIAGRTTSEARTIKNHLCYLNVNMMVLGSDDPEAATYRPYLRIPTALGIFNQIASNRNTVAAPSDKGIYARVTLEKFGGLGPAATFFKSSLGRKLTAAYQADRDGGVGIFLPDEQRRFLDWSTIRQFCSDDVEPTRLIDEFSSNSIFYRGFIFQCQTCRRASWYSVTDVGDTFVCKRCHRKQTYTSLHWKKPHQPTLYHQLDEVVYQAIRNDCHVPILALAALAGRVKGRLSFCEELDFLGQNNKLECDLNCIVDGQLTIGEVKKASRLADSASKESHVVAKYLELAERVGATRVVFATLADQWRPETEKIIKSKFGAKRQKVVLLNGEDLLGG